MRFLERRMDWIGAGIVFLVTQWVYLQTMTITVPFWDSGEFIATSYILGIPHPPGMPLYVMIGRIFSMLPIFDLVATRVNWLSALASSGTAVFTYLLTVELWRRGRTALPGGTGSADTPLEREGIAAQIPAVVAGIVAAFFVAFSRTFWDNAIEAEVYSLSSLLMAMSVWLILRWARWTPDCPGRNNLFILLYYLICLSMGVHLGTFLVLPAIVLFALLVDWRSFGGTRAAAIAVGGLVILLHPGMLPTLGMGIWVPLALGVLLAALFLGNRWPAVSTRGLLTWCLVAAVLGMSTHFYLMIRAHLNPAINEADPETWDALWKVLTRDQYKPPNPFLVRQAPWSVQLTTHFWDYAKDQYALGLRPSWMGWYLPYLLGLVGVVGHWMRERKGFVMMAVNYLILTLGLVFYLNFKTEEVRPRDYFFVAAFQFYAVWIGLGAAVLLEGLRRTLATGREAEAATGREAELVTGREADVATGREAGAATGREAELATGREADVATGREAEAATQAARGVRRIPWSLAATGVFFILLPVLTMRHYWFEHDRTEFWVARDFAHNMLVPLKPDAILFTNGDNDTFPLWYLQEVEKIRKDVRVANLSLLNTDWYIRQLRDQEPTIDFGWNDDEVSRLQPFLDQRTNRPVWVKDIATFRILEREYGRRPIYFAVTVPDLMGLEDRMVMQGLVFEMTEAVPGGGERIDAELTLHNLQNVYKYRGLLKEDGTHDDSVYKDDNARRLIQNYAAAYLRAAEEMSARGDDEAALAAIEAAAEISPGSAAVRYASGILLLQAGRLAEAEGFFYKMIEDGWREPRLYRLLGRAQEAQENYPAAERSYRQAFALAPDDFEALRDLFSYLWQVTGDQAAAVEVLREWNRRHPGDERVAEALRDYVDSIQGVPPDAELP